MGRDEFIAILALAEGLKWGSEVLVHVDVGNGPGVMSSEARIHKITNKANSR